MGKVNKSLIYAGKQAPEIKEIQQVVAVGPDVTNLKAGDWVVLNMERFIKTVKVKSTIRAGIGGQDMIKEEVVIPFFSIPGEENVYIKISSREIEGTIDDYDKLADSVKQFKTLLEFTREQEEIQDSLKGIESKKTEMFKDISPKDSGMLLKTETGSGKIIMN